MTGRIVLILAVGALLILLLVALVRCEPQSDPPGGEPKPEATVVEPAPQAPPTEEEPLHPGPAPEMEELPDTSGLGVRGH